ncbi:MAG: GTP-binding protein [Coleofasciculus sp. B1-GNL1-01]|uniref:GTP-binding protein n=1 Tax=Coleofasciculus sp. B1-GNL1-01 TaxID=3068484 RepID=UPI0032FE0F6F
MSQSPSPSPKPTRNHQDYYIHRARASLRHTLFWYNNLHHRRPLPDVELQAALQNELEVLQFSLDKLDQGVIRIATFGLVSRGKSAVVNALLGQKILQTGPLHGVTQWPKSVRWTPGGEGKVQVELIDTPGLDEVQGEARAQMAQQVASEADLILFVVAGDITRTEYQALSELRQAQKPLILVFNKIDLYPEQDREAIYQQLQELGTGSPRDRRLKKMLSPEEIVRVAAEPSPIQVRVELPDGTVNYEWETLPPQVDELKQAILRILNREGRSLLALNALFQARTAQVSIAQKTVAQRKADAEDLIWRFAKYKALAVALNPIGLLDILGGTITDLALIRSLSRLYGLPMTSYEAGKLWRKILISSGGLLLGELGSSALLGMGKSASAVASIGGVTAFAGTAVTQAGIAGYGAYTVGHAAQVYLEQGCTWGSLGASTVIQDILSQVEPDMILYRLRQELGQHL